MCSRLENKSSVVYPRRRVSARLGFAASLSHPLPQVAFSSMAIAVTVRMGRHSATCSSDCFYLLIFLFKRQVAFGEEDSLRVLFFLKDVGCMFRESTFMEAVHFLTSYSFLLCAADVNRKLLAEVELKKVSDVTQQRCGEKTSCSANCYDAHDFVLAFLKGGLVWDSW